MSLGVYKYSDVNDYTLENLRDNQLYFGLVRDMNDPFETAFDFKVSNSIMVDFFKVMYGQKYKEVVNSDLTIQEKLDHTRSSLITEAINEMRITCFSRKKDSLLMWGHYAAKNTGICISYNTEDQIFKAMMKVKYSNDMPKVEIKTLADLQGDNLTKRFLNVISTKNKEWEYEKEYRLMDIFQQEKYQLVEGSIEAIYFGLFCSEKKEQLVREALKIREVKYYRTRINTKKYMFEFYEI